MGTLLWDFFDFVTFGIFESKKDGDEKVPAKDDKKKKEDEAKKTQQ